jgi:hypothetical protein
LPLAVQFLEAPLEIIVENALQNSYLCIFHLVCTTEMLSLQLKFQNPEEVKVWWRVIK